jgi:hypothetical protein
VAHLADNLEAHLVAGLSCNFASRDICRLCHLQVQELLSINSKCGIFCNLFCNCFSKLPISDQTPYPPNPPLDDDIFPLPRCAKIYSLVLLIRIWIQYLSDPDLFAGSGFRNFYQQI